MLAEIKGLNEECGVFAVWGHNDAPQITYYGLHALQHRGQEATGMVVTNGKILDIYKGNGLVTEVFQEESLRNLKGCGSIGHVRYCTSGGGGSENIQPFLFRSSSTYDLALAHNGNLVNANVLKAELEKMGSIFHSTSDTEVLGHLIRRSTKKPFIDQVMESLVRLEGAFAYLIMKDDELIGARDPHGLRPLSLGRLGDGYILTSETCAFHVVGATFIRDIEPGELVWMNQEGIHFKRFAPKKIWAMCAMAYVYFARPDSDVDGANVHSTRKKMGKYLAQETSVDADVVIGVPDSSISCAVGYAEQSGIPYELGLIKNRYVARTFIQPSQALREQGVKMKLSPVRSIVEGKRVIMVDDSIVRGTTSRRIVNLLREAGATEVHVRIGCPPIRFPCFYGIDTSTKEELISAKFSNEEVRKLIGADSLEYLSEQALIRAVQEEVNSSENQGLCMACYTGQYPTALFGLDQEKEEKIKI